MKLGIATKREVGKRLILHRKMLKTHHVLTLNRDRCTGCGICVTICPHGAPRLRSATMGDGRLIEKPFVDIDSLKCTFCGECVILCPMNAIRMETDGKEGIPVVKSEVFPTLVKEIAIDVGKCDVACDLACQEGCPMEAMDVIVETTEGGTSRIVDVKVDLRSCIFCGKCEYTCPFDAVRVTRPMQGSIQLNPDLCQENCQVCVDVCPSKAIALSERGKPTITEELCIYCGACQEVCPKKAISVLRTRVLHNGVTSGAWITALKKLTSYTSLIHDLNARTQRKLRDAVEKIDRF